MPSIIGAVWGEINVLGIFSLKTHWIIGQKGQNSAPYAGAFWGKNHFFWRKVNQKPSVFSRVRATAGPQRRLEVIDRPFELKYT